MDIKNELLTRNLVEENSYLDKYVQLIENNISTKAIKYCTQRHHIIPVCAYKLAHCKTNNSEENIVNLIYKDHILAHYYLSLCGKDLFKHYNEEAFLYLANVNNASDNREKVLVENFDHYQLLYESAMKYVAERTRKALTGKKQSEKQILDRVSKNIGQKRSEETRRKMSSWQKGVPKKPESIEKLKMTQKTLISITDGVINKRVKEVELEYYYSLGFYRGHTKKTLPKRKMINNGIEQKYVLATEVENYLSLGWVLGQLNPGLPRTEKWRENISSALKGREFSEEHRHNISNAVRGKPRPSRVGLSMTKGRIWVHNDAEEIMIEPTDLETILSMGYSRGRLKHNQ